MKKRIVSMLLMVALVISATASAATIAPRASDYISRCGLTLSAKGDGKMSIKYEVVGTGIMTKVGPMSFTIDQKVDGKWSYYDTVYGDFYAYDALSSSGNAYFTGEPGVTYRATLNAYASNSSGSGTSEATSLTCVCK